MTRPRAGIAAGSALLVMTLAACSPADPFAVLDGLGGAGLAERCADGLPEPEGTVTHVCNDGQGGGTVPIDLEAGDYVLVVLCDGDVRDMTVKLAALTPPVEPAVGECDPQGDPAQAEIGTLDEPTLTEMTMLQHGEGDVAMFVVRR
ncbi:hypothetical protein [Cellulomonas phragmiteti]|uniref:Lipoprotein n=1 Tax=Cellulomonas phragmiteti TaxID=478780 RepID=A0ABQ4DPS2_9CELL|nr:hypothetical protein [Cellulomonas phragmiteti]GIG41345.1 hypothetical protein Cph01nite_31070 [Cellulomonas phragmiteti]